MWMNCFSWFLFQTQIKKMKLKLLITHNIFDTHFFSLHLQDERRQQPLFPPLDWHKHSLSSPRGPLPERHLCYHIAIKCNNIQKHTDKRQNNYKQYLCLATSGSRTKRFGRWGQWRKHSMQAHILGKNTVRACAFNNTSDINCARLLQFKKKTVSPPVGHLWLLLNTLNNFTFFCFSLTLPLRSCSSHTRWECVCGEGGGEDWGGSPDGEGGSGDSGWSSGNNVLR